MNSNQIIPHNCPTIEGDDIEAVTKTLRSKWLISHTETEKFESVIKDYLHIKYALSISNGHAALHLALLALGVKKGDHVIVPSLIVSDVLNPINYIGAIPIPVDCEKDGVNMDMNQAKEKMNKKVKAVIVPHMFGIPAEIDEIQGKGTGIIEDAAQALGTTYKGKQVGKFGDIGVLSFYAAKMITTGQGGMFLTNNRIYYDFAKDKISYNCPKTYDVRYNYEMTDIAASMGITQLKKLPFFLQRRKAIAAIYREIFEIKGIPYFPKSEDTDANHYRFICLFEDESDRDKIREKLREEGVQTIVPLKSYESLHVILKYDEKEFPNTKRFTSSALSLPLYPSLTDMQVEKIISVLNKCL